MQPGSAGSFELGPLIISVRLCVERKVFIKARKRVGTLAWLSIPGHYPQGMAGCLVFRVPVRITAPFLALSHFTSAGSCAAPPGLFFAPWPPVSIGLIDRLTLLLQFLWHKHKVA